VRQSLARVVGSGVQAIGEVEVTRDVWPLAGVLSSSSAWVASLSYTSGPLFGGPVFPSLEAGGLTFRMLNVYSILSLKHPA
jgi:hypothetical protein